MSGCVQAGAPLIQFRGITIFYIGDSLISSKYMGRRDGIAERAGVQEKFLAHLLMQGAGTLRGFFFHVPLNLSLIHI